MTRRLLTISFSLFLVSAMIGAFPIPGTNSVSIPSTATLEAPSSSSAISVATDTAAVAGASTTTTSADTLKGSNMTESFNASPLESIKGFRSEDLDLNTEDPLLLPKTASSGLYRASVSPLPFKQPVGMPPQKRAASAESPQQQQQQQWSPSHGQGQQWSPSHGQGQQWYPPQGQGQQWYPPQGQGQQWYPSQDQQWYPPQGQQGQQWYQQGQDRGQQIGKPYTFQKRGIVSTSANNAATAAAAPQGGSPPPYRMSALVCNQDSRTRGLIHCSDNMDYYTLEQPPNPANSADPRNRPWSSSSPAGQAATGAGPAAAVLRKRAVATQGINIPAAPPGGVSALGADPQGWFRRSQPYGAQPQDQRSQISKRQAGAGAAADAAADMPNQAAAASIAASSASAANAAAAAIHHQHGGSVSSENIDLSNLSKWSGPGYNGGTGGGSDWVGKGHSSGYGKKWKRVDHDEGNLSKWSGSGTGSGYGGGDDWSHWGKGGKGGKKWSKRQASGAYGRGGNTAAIPVPIDIGLVWDGSNVNLVPPPSPRSVGARGPGGPVPGVGGIPAGSIVVGADSPAIPVPINVDALVYPDGQMQIFPSDSRN